MGALMLHRRRITVLEAACLEELQEEYLADPNNDPCPCLRLCMLDFSYLCQDDSPRSL